jgi:hypothetical protein
MRLVTTIELSRRESQCLNAAISFPVVGWTREVPWTELVIVFFSITYARVLGRRSRLLKLGGALLREVNPLADRIPMGRISAF